MYSGYMGIMEKKMETTIMEKKMETTITSGKRGIYAYNGLHIILITCLK